MKTRVVKASELGTNCWSPLRFVNECWRCFKYDGCTHPEKMVNKKYEALRSAYDKARKELREFMGDVERRRD